MAGSLLLHTYIAGILTAFVSGCYVAVRVAIEVFAAPRTEMRNMLLVFIVVLMSVGALQCGYRFCRQVRNLPPGPWGMPIIGYLLFMGTEKHTTLMALAKRFGSVYCASLGFQLTVVLSDHNMIRAAFGRKEFTGRPDTPFMKTLNGLGEWQKIAQCSRSVS